jgi:hypothetical protein
MTCHSRLPLTALSAAALLDHATTGAAQPHTLPSPGKRADYDLRNTPSDSATA